MAVPDSAMGSERAARARSLGHRLIGLADEPSDDDDLRLRKHVGVVIGCIHSVAPLMLPAASQWLPLAWAVAIGMPLVSAANLIVLARTRDFGRYVVLRGTVEVKGLGLMTTFLLADVTDR